MDAQSAKSEKNHDKFGKRIGLENYKAYMFVRVKTWYNFKINIVTIVINWSVNLTVPLGRREDI